MSSIAVNWELTQILHYDKTLTDWIVVECDCGLASILNKKSHEMQNVPDWVWDMKDAANL